MGLLVYDVTMRMKASYCLCWLYAISSTAISLIFSMSRFPDGFTGIESKTLNVTGTHSESRVFSQSARRSSEIVSLVEPFLRTTNDTGTTKP